ncbi:MAG: hypothetical protein KIT84_43770 [Labilithrix sp.]|nr:hypothetical protein [Labilithrix sp.]MCW5817998.1 hypothetical protein [Labilithrix sp.]
MSDLKTFVFAAAVLSALGGGAFACGDEEATVRPRLDGGGIDELDGAPNDEGGPGTGALACGAALPETFESVGFATNAAVELALGQRVRELDAAMAATEGTSTAVETAANLGAIFNAGAPSLRTVATTFTQTTVDGYLTAFGAAGGKTWEPTDAEADGGAATGGKYGQLFYESPVGVDLRAAIGKALLGGALYNHVLGLVAAPVSADATVDRLVAAFGASPALANRTDLDAGVDGDRLLAELASKRDDKSLPAPGIYRRMRTAILTMKGGLVDATKCRADIDGAVATFLLEWERATYASAIYSLAAAGVAAATADPTKGPVALHAYGDALGLIQSFKGLPADKRRITDAQIDALLTKIGADTPYRLVTSPGTRVLALGEAINDIALYEGFDAAAVEAFRKSF